MSEKRYILAEDGSAYKKLIVKLKEYEGHRLLELRYHYFDKKKHEFFPTKKGIALTKSNYLTVKKVIEKNHEQVMDWLGVGYVPEHIARNQQAQEEAYQEIEYSSGAVEVKAESYARDPDFFKCNHEGGKIKIAFNTAHPISLEIMDLLNSKKEGEKAVKIIASLLAAYSSAKHRLANSPSAHPEILFEQLEYDWAEYLKT